MANGNMIWQMDMVNLFTLMEIFMKEIGKIKRLMEMEYIKRKVEQDMRALGKMINNMVLEKSYGQMAQFMKANLIKD